MGYEKNLKKKRKSRYLYDLAKRRPKGEANVKVKNVTFSPRAKTNSGGIFLSLFRRAGEMRRAEHPTEMIVFSHFVKEKSPNPLRATDTIGEEKGRFLKFRVFAAREKKSASTPAAYF